jgi:hypothetical protein
MGLTKEDETKILDLVKRASEYKFASVTIRFQDGQAVFMAIEEQIKLK